MPATAYSKLFLLFYLYGGQYIINYINVDNITQKDRMIKQILKLGGLNSYINVWLMPPMQLCFRHSILDDEAACYDNRLLFFK